MFREFHHAIGCTTRPEGCGVGESKARDSEFHGVAEREVLVVVGGVDEHLEGAGVEQVDKEPRAHHPRQIAQHTDAVLADGLPTFGKLPNHDADGADAEQ